MKGRIWSRIGAVVWLKSVSVALKAGVEACACGISLVRAGKATFEKRLELARPALAARSVAGNSCSESWIDCCWLAKLPRAASEEVTKRLISESWRPSSVVSSPKSWITRASATCRWATTLFSFAV